MNRLPKTLFAAALALVAFAGGGLVVHYQLFPVPIVADGVTAMRALHGLYTAEDTEKFIGFADMPRQHAAANRLQVVAGGGLGGPVLWQGGRHQFLDYCPEWGCLAVEYAAGGEVAHAYPFRNDELEQAVADASSAEFPYESSPAASFARDFTVFGVSRYANGDLLVVFYQGYVFPFGAGVARIDRDGHPVWFRRDYSHHWPHVEDDDVALVPGASIGSESISFGRAGEPITLKCPSNRAYLDAIGVIDGGGRLLRRIDLVDALRASPFQYVMQTTSGPGADGRGRIARCDPFHLNFVHRAGADAGGAWGLAPGDLVASLRNLSAFAILDAESGRVKRLVRGSFFYQHSVQHLTGATFLMFDNYGGDGRHGPSRLLMIDLADGRETTIFPNERTPEPLRGLFTHYQGKIDISPDRRRALVAFSEEGVAVEVRLADGAVLNAFRSLHDVSSWERLPDQRRQSAGLFKMFGLNYIQDV